METPKYETDGKISNAGNFSDYAQLGDVTLAVNCVVGLFNFIADAFCSSSDSFTQSIVTCVTYGECVY